MGTQFLSECLKKPYDYDFEVNSTSTASHN